MIEPKCILFPIDFSAQSRAVAPFVKAMAKCLDAEVTVLHAAGPDAASELERFVAEQFPGIRATAELGSEDPAQAIVNRAQSLPAGLIMMPTHGHGPFRAMLLGSVTAKVLHDAHCPIWTGVHAEKMLAHSPDRWKRVLCALDTVVDAESVLQWALNFARDQHLELRVVHAVAGTDSMWTEQADPSMYEFLFRAAREKLAALQAKLGTDLEIVLLPGSVGNAVHQAALDFDADVIVCGRGAAHEAFGPLRSHAYAIIREAPCPVISTP